MIKALIAIFGFILVVLAGCVDQTEPAADARKFSSSAQTESGSVRLTVWADSDELRTVDQLGVHVEIKWALSQNVQLIEPDWESAGWTLIDSYPEPDMVDGDGFIQRLSFTIEPFLEGQYSIPPIAAKTNHGAITTDPITVTVHSVLDKNAANELADHRPLAIPSEPESSSTNAVTILGVVGGLLIAYILFWVMKKSSTSPEPTPREQLQAIANGNFENETEAFQCVHRVIATMEITPKTIELEAECEQHRFDRCPSDSSDPRRIAEQAIQMMGGV